MAGAGRAVGDGTSACTRCDGAVREARERLSIELPRSGVTASIEVPARRCARCGGVEVEPPVRARAHLALACGLADVGVETGEALRHMRKALGLRAADLARLLGVTPETISHWETGKAGASRAAFAALAAMVEDALAGRTTTRDRLAACAEGRPCPRVLSVAMR